MSFSNFKSIQDVIQKYPLKINRERFLPEVTIDLPDLFLDNLNFSLSRKTDCDNEYYFSENFIYPFLHFAWRRHERLQLWSHKTLEYDAELYGEPDYFISYWPESITNSLIAKPLLAVVEAKKQDFEAGWGQCLAELIACQKLNDAENVTLYGIVSTGIIWEFAKLKNSTFTRDITSYSVANPQLIMGLIDNIFELCESQLP